MQTANLYKKTPSLKMKILKYGFYIASAILLILIILYFGKSTNINENIVINKNNIEIPLIDNPRHSTVELGTQSKLAGTVENEQNFDTFLKSLSEMEREQIEILKSTLFHLIDRPTNQEFKVLLLQGFPSKNELNLTSRYRFDELSIMLLNNKIENSVIESEIHVNKNSLRVINFSNTISEIEKIISYYHTDFKFSSGENPNLSWSEGRKTMPSQIKEALESLVYANAALSTETGLELLAKAKFEEMMSYWNNEDTNKNTRFFIYLSEASKKLPFLGIDDYVRSEFPESYDAYISLKNKDDK